MGVTQTSLEAYEKTKPKAKTNREIVLEVIKKNKGITDAEIANRLRWPINRVTPRRNELANQGKILKMRKRTCKITNGTAYEWWAI